MISHLPTPSRGMWSVYRFCAILGGVALLFAAASTATGTNCSLNSKSCSNDKYTLYAGGVGTLTIQGLANGDLILELKEEGYSQELHPEGKTITVKWDPPEGYEGCGNLDPQTSETVMSYTIKATGGCTPKSFGGSGGRSNSCWCEDEFGNIVSSGDCFMGCGEYVYAGFCEVFGNGQVVHNLKEPSDPENDSGKPSDPEPLFPDAPGGGGGGGAGSDPIPDELAQEMGLGRNVGGTQSLGKVRWTPGLGASDPLNFEDVELTGAVVGLSSEFYTSGSKRQILATAAPGTTASGATLVEITPLDPMAPNAGYVITAYDVKGVSIPGSGTPFSPSSNQMISRVTVERGSKTVGSATLPGVGVKIEEVGQLPRPVAYYAEPTPGGGSGVVVVVDGTEGTIVTDPGYSEPPGGGPEEKTVQYEGIRKDAEGNDIVVSFTQEKYVLLGGREKLVEKTEGANAQKVTLYSYYDDEEQQATYGKQHIVLNSDGSWARYFYDIHGEVSEIWETWLDVGAPTIAGIEAITGDQCKVRKFERFPSWGLGFFYVEPTTTITTTFVQGIKTSRNVTSKRGVHDTFTGLSVSETVNQTFAGNGVLVSESRTGMVTPPGGTVPSRTVYSASLDGTRTTYEGPEGGGPGTYVTTRGTVSQPGGIPRKTLQTVRIEEGDGDSSEETRVALGGGSYATMSVRTVDEDTSTDDVVTTTSQDGIVVDVTTVEPDGTTTAVDAAGITTVSTINALTGTSTVTRLGGDAITVAPYGELHDGSDLATVTSIHARPSGPGGVPPGSIERVRRVTGAQSRTESETEVDEAGDAARSTDVYGRATVYTYGVSPEGGRMVAETGPGGVTRISTYYRDGRLKSLTGSGAVAQYYSYEWNDMGELLTTVRNGSAQSPRWQRTVSDGAGRTLREERPAFGGNGITLTEHVYNAKAKRVKVLRTGLAALLYEYDDAGNLFRQGVDLNGDGVLNLTGSLDPITESSAHYEQIGGLWWQVSQSREYFGDGSDAAGFRKTDKRRALGLGPNQVSLSIDATGRQAITTTVYDRATRTVRTASSMNEAPNMSEVVETLAVNGLGVLQTSSISAERNTVRKYDAWQRLTSQSGPGGSFTYAYEGVLERITSKTQTTGSTNLVTSYTYFGSASANAGEVESVTAPASVLSPEMLASVHYEYDTLGHLTGQWGNGSYPVRYRYNALGDRVEMWTYRTSTAGTGIKPWVPGQFTPSGLASVTTWVVDAATGLLQAKRDATGKGTVYHYDTSGQLSQRIWARTVSGSPLATTYQYDGAGRLIVTNYSDATPDVTFTYFRDGSLRQVTDGAGVRTFDRLSGLGISTRETIAGGGSAGNVLEGLTIEQPVDDRGRRKSFSGRFIIPGQASVPLPVVGYAYQDGWVGVTPPGETIAWNYAGSPEMRFVRGTTYDGTSKRHKLTTQRSLGSAASFKSTTEIDAALGTVRVSHQHGSATPFQSRTRSGNSVEQVDPDITVWPVSVAAHERWSYANDMRGQIISASKSAATTPGGTSLSEVSGWGTSYTYDDIGNRKNVSSGQIEYATNALNQYTSIANTREFTMRGAAPTDTSVTVNGQSADRHGIHFTKTVQAGGNGPRWESVEIEASRTVSGTPHTTEQTGQVYVPPALETPIYDEDGNLVADGRWNYTWDGENRLVGMSTHNVAASAGVPQVTLAFAYDYGGRRIAKTVSKYFTAQSAWRTTSDLRFLYEGWNLMAEVELLAEQAPGATSQAGVSPRLFRSFVWGPDVSGTWDGAGGVGGLLGMTRHQRAGQTAESYMTTCDLNGNVIGLYGANGKLAVYDYDAFGQVHRANEPEVNLNPFRFSTKYTDSETGFAYYGYRYYDAVRGRWINRDPLGEDGGENLCAMLRNCLATQVDFLGLKLISVTVHASFNEDVNAILEYYKGGNLVADFKRRARREDAKMAYILNVECLSDGRANVSGDFDTGNLYMGGYTLEFTETLSYPTSITRDTVWGWSEKKRIRHQGRKYMDVQRGPKWQISAGECFTLGAVGWVTVNFEHERGQMPMIGNWAAGMLPTVGTGMAMLGDLYNELTAGVDKETYKGIYSFLIVGQCRNGKPVITFKKKNRIVDPPLGIYFEIKEGN